MAFLLAAVSPVLAQAGAPLAASVAATFTREVQPREATITRTSHLREATLTREGHARSDLQQHALGDEHLRPAGDELRLHPVLTTRAVRKWEQGWSDPRGAARQGLELHACVGCVGAGWRGHTVFGGLASGEKGHKRAAADGVGGELYAHAFLALASVESAYSLTLKHRLGSAGAQARLTGVVGGEAHGRATVTVGKQRQEVHAAGTLMAGASVRAEERTSARFAGIAVQQTGGVEGWAGAGATGRLHAAHTGKGTYEFGVRAGAATGLGAAADYSAMVDATAFLRAHERGSATAAWLLPEPLAAIGGPVGRAFVALAPWRAIGDRWRTASGRSGERRRH